MPAPPKDWIALTAKLERAEEHIFNLQDFWWKFRDRYYRVECEDDPQTGNHIYKLATAPPLDADIPLIAGDAIQNLRSALDHIAYRLVCVGTDSDGPFDKVYFPIGELPKEFKARIRAIKKCLPTGTEEALRQIEAYPGGKGEVLWQIHRLNNIDKHRLLLTLTCQNRLEPMNATELAKMRYLFRSALEEFPTEQDAMVFLTERVTPLFDLKAGDVLAVYPPSEPKKKRNFPIEIAFAEPQIAERKPVLEMLHKAAHHIRHITMTFDQLGFFG